MAAQKKVFDNLPEYLSPEQVSHLYPISKWTVYDWQYRPVKYRIPAEMLKKFGRKLMVRRETLENWINSRNT